MTDSYADTPVSISELRAEREDNAALWTPRDVLIDLLRGIDKGVVAPDALVVAYRTKVGSGVTQTEWSGSSPDLHTTLGLLALAARRIMDSSNRGE